MLVSHAPGAEPVYETIRARQAGRVFIEYNEKAKTLKFFFLFEEEGGLWFVQEIEHDSDLSKTFLRFYPFLSLNDAESIFPNEINYILNRRD
jgi:hypothetical protein